MIFKLASGGRSRWANTALAVKPLLHLGLARKMRTMVTDMLADSSEYVVVDAQDVTSGPVCRIVLPHRICAGTHATWANGDAIRTAQASLQTIL